MDWSFSKPSVKWSIAVQAILVMALNVPPVLLEGYWPLLATLPASGALVALVALAQWREAAHRRQSRYAPILTRLQQVVSHLLTLTQGAHGPSVWKILSDLVGNPDFQAQMESRGNTQVGSLLIDRCQKLFSNVDDLHRGVEQLTATDSDVELRKAVLSLQRLFHEYRQLVDEFDGFCRETKSDQSSVQDQASFCTRIHAELRTDYNRLMDDVRQLRSDLDEVGIEFLRNHELPHRQRPMIWSE